MERGRTFLFENFDDGTVSYFTRPVVEYDHLFLNLPGYSLGHLGIVLEGHMLNPESVESTYLWGYVAW